jgi:hypothetical protein
MLALTVDAILDLAGPRRGNFRLIECEVSSHDAYVTPRELFVALFDVIAATLREILETDWSPEIDGLGGRCWTRSRASLRGAKPARRTGAHRAQLFMKSLRCVPTIF